MTDDVYAWLRWVFGGFIAVIASLLALAWRGLNVRVDALQVIATAHTATEVLHGERITRVEERFSAHTEILQRIDHRLERIEAKLYEKA